LPIHVGQEVIVEIKTKVDDFIFRAVAKIAFNYLVKIAGIEFATKSDFDPIRNYIRYGEKPNYKPVYFNQKPILAYDSNRIRQTNGHLLTLDWSSNGQNLLGQVSLFNFATYKVILARSFSGIYIPIRSGHLFDIQTFLVLTEFVVIWGSPTWR
jgi:hypothetical protein